MAVLSSTFSTNPISFFSRMAEPFVRLSYLFRSRHELADFS